MFYKFYIIIMNNSNNNMLSPESNDWQKLAKLVEARNITKEQHAKILENSWVMDKAIKENIEFDEEKKLNEDKNDLFAKFWLDEETAVVSDENFSEKNNLLFPKSNNWEKLARLVEAQKIRKEQHAKILENSWIIDKALRENIEFSKEKELDEDKNELFAKFWLEEEKIIVVSDEKIEITDEISPADYMHQNRYKNRFEKFLKEIKNEWNNLTDRRFSIVKEWLIKKYDYTPKSKIKELVYALILKWENQDTNYEFDFCKKVLERSNIQYQKWYELSNYEIKEFKQSLVQVYDYIPETTKKTLISLLCEIWEPLKRTFNTSITNAKKELLFNKNYNHKDVINKLLEGWYDINSRNEKNKTLLEEILYKWDKIYLSEYWLDNISYLIDKGADFDLKDKDGINLLWRNIHNYDLAKLLIDKWADLDISMTYMDQPLICSVVRFWDTRIIKIFLEKESSIEILNEKWEEVLKRLCSSWYSLFNRGIRGREFNDKDDMLWKEDLILTLLNKWIKEDLIQYKSELASYNPKIAESFDKRWIKYQIIESPQNIPKKGLY